ncbi:gamma-glutamyl-gamma-aminobutyrate hydrolase family protein [Plastorhodobacter daqingensis]|uniref:Gamma-glutamyl-gamma-aminobutyrate hydrolase family protein n=1 Tax=Plastorhodobacter daqingensis TaxID=1387281 RepID=A0ABW2UJ25_9RHOB
MTRPLIAVTTSQRSGWRIFPLVALNIWLAGGQAQRWDAGRPSDLDGVEGLIVGGGDDISPELYGMSLVASARLDPARDDLERRLVSGALDRNMPVLGICRGAQMLNVALGGTLDQDAYASHQDSRRYRTILPRKRVMLRPGTRLHAIAGAAPMRVNALHSQAVARLGHALQVAARDEGGMIQAIERTSDPFALGVQWHPEHLFYARRQRALFRALVCAADAYRCGSHQGGAVDRSADGAAPA